ncbi:MULTISPECIES: DinB family protein [Roseobacteraceae]|uniref:DinB family protein n=1 Tax=Roseobacteraceae TaxID=2854170 RepID=UPI003298D2CE
MIEPSYVQMMARYNRWQNEQLMPVLQAMPAEELSKDRGAFFGSLLGTANHLLWGDTIWMSRFDPSVAPPAVAAADNTKLHPTIQSWATDRVRMDGHITLWAEGLRAADLLGDLDWTSGLLKTDMRAPMATAVTHFFNHQTHHRGQIHMMLTAAGQTAPVTDLIFLPEDT